MATRNRDTRLILLLCGVALVRVLVFAASYPLFGPMDEQAHFDTVHKYARGYWPRAPVERFDRPVTALLAAYGTFEYFIDPATRPGGRLLDPPWRMPHQEADAYMRRHMRYWARLENHEAHEPPVYYALAALWYRLGGALGLDEWRQIYFVRFLNGPLYALLVWLSYVLCRDLYPRRRLVFLGAPLLLTAAPLDVFYAINNDVLSAPLFTLSLILLWRWQRQERVSIWLGATVGLLVALTFLVKVTNLALPLLLGGVLVLMLRQVVRQRRPARHLWAVLAAAAAAATPVGLWLWRNLATHGDLTGSHAKIRFCQYLPRPLSAWLEHPIWTPGGLWTFWSSLVHSFWRGEIVWHRQALAHPAADALYLTLTTLLLPAALIWSILAWRRRRATQSAPPPAHHPPLQDPEPMLWGVLLASMGLLVVLSLAFDYSRSVYPSAAHPYLTSARIISGAVVAFLTLFVLGLDWLLARAGRYAAAAVLVAIAAAATVSEMILLQQPLASPWNWLHLP